MGGLEPFINVLLLSEVDTDTSWSLSRMFFITLLNWLFSERGVRHMVLRDVSTMAVTLSSMMLSLRREVRKVALKTNLRLLQAWHELLDAMLQCSPLSLDALFHVASELLVYSEVLQFQLAVSFLRRFHKLRRELWTLFLDHGSMRRFDLVHRVLRLSHRCGSLLWLGGVHLRLRLLPDTVAHVTHRIIGNSVRWANVSTIDGIPAELSRVDAILVEVHDCIGLGCCRINRVWTVLLRNVVGLHDMILYVVIGHWWRKNLSLQFILDLVICELGLDSTFTLEMRTCYISRQVRLHFCHAGVLFDSTCLISGAWISGRLRSPLLENDLDWQVARLFVVYSWLFNISILAPWHSTWIVCALFRKAIVSLSFNVDVRDGFFRRPSPS